MKASFDEVWRPPFFNPVISRATRRSPNYHYNWRGSYLITISKAPSAPCFGSLLGSLTVPHDPPRVELSPVGRIVAGQIARIPEAGPFVIDAFVIMPDHLHLLWRVCEDLKEDLGAYVGRFKSYTTRQWRRESGGGSDAPLFGDRFNDRIVYNDEIALRFRQYIADNPRRLLVRQQKPHFFERRHRVDIGGREMEFYGNFQLLRYPVFVPAYVSSRWTEEERDHRLRQIDMATESCGVLVSPFISPDEKKIMDRALEAGASVIRIVADGMGERYRPSGREFGLCSEGRCLHIGLPKEGAGRAALSRGSALAMNAFADWLCHHTQKTMKVLALK